MSGPSQGRPTRAGENAAIAALCAELQRLGADHGLSVWHPSWNSPDGPRVVTVTRHRPLGVTFPRCEICNPAATLAALRALPDGAGVDAAWEAL